MSGALLFVEVGGWSPAMVGILDAMEKMSGVRLIQAELNDRPGVCMKLTAPLGDIEAARGAAEQTARGLETEIIAHIIAGPAESPPSAGCVMRRGPISIRSSSSPRYTSVRQI